MTIGVGIFLIVVGAVLAFAVKTSFSAFDVTTLGYILMGAGVVVVLIAVILLIPRSRRTRSTAASAFVTTSATTTRASAPLPRTSCSHSQVAGKSASMHGWSTAVSTDSLGRQYVTERDDRVDGL